MSDKPIYERLVEKWPEASSLKDAMRLAGSESEDPRYWHRVRRKAEQSFGITLPPHNEQNSSDRQIACPSTLNLKKAKKHKDFIITSCANDSPIEEMFLSLLEEMAEDYKAQLLVVPIRYQNPSAMNRSSDYTWDERIHPYALLDDLDVSKNLVISGLRLQATAKRPLSGLEANSGEKSAIYGHSQLAMELVATPKNQLPKMMHTTGAINKPFYSATKAGGQATFNHSVSAVYVKIVGDVFYHTQLCFDGNGFYFIDTYYHSDEDDTVAHVSEGVVNVMADVHSEIADISVWDARERLNDISGVDTLVWHDIHNQTAMSKHSTTINNIKLAQQGRLNVQREIHEDAAMLAYYGKDRTNLIVESNHDRHLDDWLNSFNPKNDPYNAIYAGKLFSLLEYSEDESILQLAIMDAMKNDEARHSLQFLSPNDPHKIYGIDVSQHGDRGANGSRGSRRGIANTSMKTVIGHSHSPGITMGCWQVGAAIFADYAKGLSSWLPADVLIFPNGKRQMITYIDGKSLADFI